MIPFPFVDRASSVVNKLYRYMTSSNRVLPDFLIIGAQKAGTTSLYSYLCQHPGIIPAMDKEIHFFDNPHHRAQGEFWYRSHFCIESEKHQLKEKMGYLPLTGEATPSLIFSYHTPKFVSSLVPDIKLIILLRDPIDRAFSHYNHNYRREGKELLSFEDAIEKETERIENDLECLIQDENFDEENIKRYSYIHRGFYDEQLERWFQYFSKEQFCILESEKFFIDSQYQLEVVLRFLRLPQFKFDVTTKLHVGGYSDKIPTEIEEKLRAVFRSHNQNLYKMLDRDFGW
jgi:Sulfotransferase domain